MKPMTAAQLAQARIAVLENAGELVADAELLLEHGRHARAFSVAVLACEEVVKIPMLTTAAVRLERRQSVDWKKLARRLSAHGDKLLLLEMFTLLFSEETNDPAVLEQKHQANIVERRRPNWLNKSKQDGFYVRVEPLGAQRPSSMISVESAQAMTESARNLHGLFARIENDLSHTNIERQVRAAENWLAANILDHMASDF